MGFVIACFVFLVCAFYWLFFPSSVAHICLSALSVFEPVSHHVHVYVGGNGSPSPISFERVRALCRSMGSVGGGSRLGRGWDSRFPCFWCSMPQRVSVSLMYVLSLVLRVLPGACVCVVVKDQCSPLTLNLVHRFTFAGPNLLSVYPPVSFEFLRALCRSMDSTGGGSRFGRGGVPLHLVFHAPARLGRFDVRFVTCLTHSPGACKMSSDHGSTFSSDLSTSLIASLSPNQTYAPSSQARKSCLGVSHAFPSSVISLRLLLD
jgi:hypothetical protein